MASRMNTASPLVVTGKAPDAPFNIQLHPLVLLSISEYITRHTMRQRAGPIVGAVIGQQTGRSYTLEHAFHCLVVEDARDLTLDGEWFCQRLEMYKDVHKDPALDLVAMFAIAPVDGPQATHISLLKQVQELVSLDSTLLLLFHPEQVDSLQGGKLPISLYEKIEEVDGEQTKTRFRELSFEVETGEAERIGVDFVAKGGGAATAVPKVEPVASSSSSREKKGKGRAKAKDEDGEVTTPTSVLSPEDDELISSLNAKVNSIKMLEERIELIRTYLASLPRSYLTDASSTDLPPEETNFKLLRSINAMISRLPLLAPPGSSLAQASTSETETSAPSKLELAAEKERQDVQLTTLLASLTRSIAEAQAMGARLNIVQREKLNRERAPFGRGGGGGGRLPGSAVTDEGILADAGGM